MNPSFYPSFVLLILFLVLLFLFLGVRGCLFIRLLRFLRFLRFLLDRDLVVVLLRVPASMTDYGSLEVKVHVNAIFTIISPVLTLFSKAVALEDLGTI